MGANFDSAPSHSLYPLCHLFRSTYFEFPWLFVEGNDTSDTEDFEIWMYHLLIF